MFVKNRQKLLMQFLIDENCILRYIRNVKRFHEKKMSEAIKGKPPEDYIKLFGWNTSKEGFTFWRNVHLKWKKVLHENSKGRTKKQTNSKKACSSKERSDRSVYHNQS